MIKYISNLILIFITAYSIQSSFAQLPFQKVFFGNGEDIPYCIRELEDGSLIITGSTTSFSSGDEDIFVMKVSSGGQIIWSKAYGGLNTDFPRSIIETAEGDLVVFGSTYSFGEGNKDMYLLKIDNEGNLKWAKTYGGNQEERGFCITKSTDGGFILGGTTLSQSYYYRDALIIKVNDSGEKEWSKVYNQWETSTITDIVRSNDNEYLVLGIHNDISRYNHDIYVMKINDTGDFLWATSIVGFGDDNSRVMTKPDMDEFFICGHTQSWGAGSYDYFLAKINSSTGSTEWAKTYGGSYNDYGACINFSNDNGLLLAGKTESFGSGNRDLFLIKTDRDGNELWSTAYGGPNQENLSFGGNNYFVQTDNDSIILIGSTTSYLSGGNNNIYFIKSDNEGTSGCEEVEFNPVVTNISLSNNPLMFNIFNTPITENETSTTETKINFIDSLICGQSPIADFDYDIIESTRVSFINLSQYADHYKWLFGDGNTSLEKDPVHDYGEFGDYVVTLVAYNDFTSDTITKMLTLCEMPISAFDVSIDGFTLSFNNISQNADTYFWTFGDGNQSTLENPIYTYYLEGEYIVSLVATNVCGADTLNKTISICKLPVADFEFNQPTGHEISFINKSLEYESCYWYFGDGCGSFAQNPSHIYNQQGDYKVKLIVNNYCGADSLTKFISISVDWPYEERLFFIYPNPTRGLLTLKLINVNPVDAKIDLFNYRGKFIKSYAVYINGEATIDLSEFSSGIYILKLQSDLINNRYKKVVKLF